MATIYSRGVARFRHASTGEVFTIYADELDWAEFAADERQMGIEIGHSAQIDHPQLGTLAWELWEYPVGVENMRETHANGHALLENIDFGLQDFPDDDEPEDDTSLAVRLAALPGQLDALEQLLAELRSRSSMIGHNRAPAESRLDVAHEQIEAAQASITELRDELAKPDAAQAADPTTIRRAENRLRRLAVEIGRWMKLTAGLAAKGGFTAGSGLVVKEAITRDQTLHALVIEVADTLLHWLHLLGLL